ncbi:hypothetical protein [Neglectibacter caecimuris]|uniref:hypothetical protein n=1 Tax=Neglectibacter caecimuris TaxID=3093658 RepID=UPI002AC89C35|nr:hypothetical protein [Neglectibacter sp. M00184]
MPTFGASEQRLRRKTGPGFLSMKLLLRRSFMDCWFGHRGPVPAELGVTLSLL